MSNWARPGHECRHNVLYWAQGEYLGVGCAAHGHTTEERSPYRGPGPEGGASTDDGAEERSPYRGPGPEGGASTDDGAEERSPSRDPGPGGGASTDDGPEERSPYRGPGPGGGASTDHGGVSRRWWNVRTPERYVDRIRAGRSPESGAEHLDRAARAEEQLTLALRTRWGVPVPPGAGAVVDDLRAAGLLDVRPGSGGPRAVLTRRGRLLGGDVTARILLARSPAAPAAPPAPVPSVPAGGRAGLPAGTRYTRVPAAASHPDRGREPGDRGLFFAGPRADTTGAEI